LLTLMKGQPLAYNKDNQEDKEPLFDTVDTLRGCLRAFGDLVPTMQVRRERMREAARAGFTTATDFADYLVRLGIPFRDAHAVVGAAVRIAVERGCELKDLSLAELQALDRRIGTEVFASLDVDAALAARNHRGGTAPARVRAACAEARLRLGKEAAP
jgi:argininosuccinate lyase